MSFKKDNMARVINSAHKSYLSQECEEGNHGKQLKTISTHPQGGQLKKFQRFKRREFHQNSN